MELTFWPDVPLVFMVFDLLEVGGKDIRERPLRERRELLDRFILPVASMFHISSAVAVANWSDLAALIDQSRASALKD